MKARIKELITDQVTVSGTILSTGQFYKTSNPSGFGLDSKIDALSGYVGLNYATAEDLLAVDGRIDLLSGYSNSIFEIKTNVTLTGSVLDNKINSASGFAVDSYATKVNLQSTGSNLDNKIDSLSGYTNEQIAGITVSNVVYTTGDQTISGVKTFDSRPLVGAIPVLLSGEGGSTTSSAITWATLGAIQCATTETGTVFANPAVTNSLVRQIKACNTSASTSTLKLYKVPNNGGAVGSADVTNLFWNTNLPSKSSVHVFVPNGIPLLATNDAFKAYSSVQSGITIELLGDQPTSTNQKMLKDISYVTDTTGTLVLNDTKVNIYDIILHNVGATTVTTKIFNVPSGAAAGSTNQSLELQIPSNDTVFLGEELGIIWDRLGNIGDLLKMNASTGNNINVMVIGQSGASI